MYSEIQLARDLVGWIGLEISGDIRDSSWNLSPLRNPP